MEILPLKVDVTLFPSCVAGTHLFFRFPACYGFL
uniref:Uncharacterized protein n=1 Tax=Anguilla anguilla TaxID=7936 RepID=A0A0E9VLE9_ANGAN